MDIGKKKRTWRETERGEYNFLPRKAVAKLGVESERATILTVVVVLISGAKTRRVPQALIE